MMCPRAGCTRPVGNGRVRLDELERAKRALDLRRPVDFSHEMTEDHHPLAVGYSMKDEVTGGHLVRVARGRQCDRHMARTVLHELRHAAQREYLTAEGVDCNVAYTILYDRHGYDDHPFERDARAWARANLDKYDLIEGGTR